VVKISQLGEIKVNWIADGDTDEYAAENNNFWSQATFKLISPVKEPTTTNPFLKTVTETRIVSAYHDLPNGLELFVESRNGEVKIDLESGTWDKQSLAELARILAEISEAMA
jgi:hypothetical protein